MKYLHERRDINLAIWETNPRKRNGSTIKFYINRNESVSVDDHIVVNTAKDNYSQYTILEIISRKEGTTKGKDYVVAKVNWKSTKTE